MTLFYLLAAAVAGLIVGSFLNVCIHRLPRGESIVFPPSHCPACGATIAPDDNVPILSWIWLGRKCRTCRAPISFRYPLVEAANALFWTAAAMRSSGPADFLAMASLASACLVLLFIDLDWQLLPDAVTLPLAAVGLALSFFRRQMSPRESLAGLALGAGSLALVAIGYRVLAGREGMGWGDVKMLGMVGAFLGPAGVVITLLIGSLGGSLLGLALVALRGATLRLPLPFGVFLALGALLALLFPPQLLTAYRSLLLG